MSPLPRVTFGTIVLNGEPFTRYCLHELYPFAHQIVVVEGACPDAANVATPDGHSRDATLQVLRDFQRDEDPEHKLVVVTAEDEGHPNGFWPGEKNQQSEAYARRASGDYLWQVDVDEFYKPEDMTAVLETLRDDPAIGAVTFQTLTFWGGFDCITDGWYLRGGAAYYHRLFRWGPGYHYATHRPPTVHDAHGRDLRAVKWLRGQELAKRGILMYHYSLLLPKQVFEKCEYYSSAAYFQRPHAVRWARETFMGLRQPYRVHNVYEHVSWLEAYHGSHPPQAAALRDDLVAGRLGVAMRNNADVQRLLRSPWYRLGRLGLKLWFPLYRAGEPAARSLYRSLYRSWRRALVLTRHTLTLTGLMPPVGAAAAPTMPPAPRLPEEQRQP